MLNTKASKKETMIHPMEQSDIDNVFMQAILKGQDGERIVTWDDEQRQVLALSSKESCNILNLDAGAGTGKTTTMCASMATFLQGKRENGLVIATACTNAAVVQIAETLDKFIQYKKHVRIIRFASVKKAGKAPFDIQELIMKHIVNLPNLSPAGETWVNSFVHAYDCVKKRLKATKQNRVKYAEELDNCAEATRALTSLLLSVYRPSVICCTLSTLLNNTKSNDAFNNFVNTKKHQTIWVDESSQVPAKAILVLSTIFPTATQRYVGDPRQLPPYCEQEWKPIKGVSSLLYTNLTIPRLTLRLCRRMHPSITDMVSFLFYQGTLKAAVLPIERSLFSQFAFPKKEVPIQILNINGESTKVGTSLVNNAEATESVRLAERIMKHGKIKADQICIICFYKAQLELLDKKKLPYTLMTVDSVQGKEYEVVILLTTRTEGSGDFISDKKRVNVAMSRAREALFILGHHSYLASLPLWKKCINYAKKEGIL